VLPSPGTPSAASAVFTALCWFKMSSQSLSMAVKAPAKPERQPRATTSFAAAAASLLAEFLAGDPMMDFKDVGLERVADGGWLGQRA